MKSEIEYRLERSESVFIGHLCNGFLFDYELSGPDGAHFTLFVPNDADKTEIEKAKTIIRQDRDATGFSVVRVDPAILAKYIHTEQPVPKTGWIESMRWIVSNKQCRKIDAEGNFIPKKKAGGQLCDLFTASRMVQIYDSLNEKNREKFHNMSFAVAHHVAMSL